MSTIGSLDVVIRAKTDNFSRGMKKAREEVSLFSRSASALSGMITGIAGAFAAGSLVRSLHATAQEMDGINAAAERLGITTKSLSSLAHAADISESSLDGLVRGLTLLQKNIGSGTAESALGRVGLDIDDLRKMRADDQLLAIAGAMQKLQTPAEKTALAMKLFGRSGAELLPLLNEGPDKIRELQIEAEKLGIAFDDATAKKIDEADKAMIRLMASVEGLKRQLVTDLAPAFGMVADEITKGFQRESVAFKLLFPSVDAYLKYRKGLGSGQMGGALMSPSMLNASAIRSGSPGMAGMAPGMGFGMPAMVMAMNAALFPDRGAQLDIADMHRITNSIDEMLAKPSIAKARRFDSDIRGNSALERGSAAAFTQEKRSQQQNQQLDISRKQLRQAEEQTKALQNIDRHIQATESTLPANIV